MQSNTALIPDTIIVGEQLYSEAISLILKNAQRELLIFDQDLSHGDFASLEKYNLLYNFLSANIASQLKIILQDARFFQTKCPRLCKLLAIYGHKMSVHVTDASVRHIKECFILADGKNYIKRIHIDQARFKYTVNDEVSAEVINNRFIELTTAIEDIVPTKPLGL
jgi:hypothetical protein